MRWQRVGEDAFLTRLDDHWTSAIDARAALRERLVRASCVDDFILTEDALLVRAQTLPELSAWMDAAWLDAPPSAREHLIDVRYAGEDLETAANILNISRYDIIDLHTASEFRVSFNGFLPGFAYLRGLHPTLASIPRRTSPRPRVPARAVAIAAGMSAIYPAASPGGWQLLGEAIDFDALGTPLMPGDRVRFCATERLHVEKAREDVASQEGVRVEAVRGIALLVDGVPMRSLRAGVAPGGPLLSRAALRANAAVGNDEQCALIERIGDITLLVTSGIRTRRIANESGEVTTLAAGESITLPWRSSARVGYIAIEGGFDVPMVLGGRGTLLSIQAGGLDGRPLHRGDCIPLGAPSPRPSETRAETNTRNTFSLVPSIDFERYRDALRRSRHATSRLRIRVIAQAHAFMAKRSVSTSTCMRSVARSPSCAAACNSHRRASSS